MTKFKSLLFMAMLAAACVLATRVHADDPPTVVPTKPQDQVDSSEAYRRGACVVVTGEGPRASEDDAYLIAMSPPAADDHMWYVSVFGSPGDAATQKLLQDLRNYPELAVFVTAPEQSLAWSHLNVYDINDETQKHRVEKYKLQGIPTLVIQPPRNGMWGNPRIVVGQTTYNGDPKKLAAWMRTTLRAFVKRASEAGYPKDVHATIHATDPVPGGAGVDPPFATPNAWEQPTQRPNLNFNFPFPDQQPQQPTPPATPTLPFEMPSGGTLGILILVGLKAFEMYSARTKSPVDDRIAKLLRNLLTNATPKKKPEDDDDQ